MVYPFIADVARICRSWVIIFLLGIGMVGCANGLSGMGKPVQSKAPSYEPNPAAGLFTRCGGNPPLSTGWLLVAG